MLPSVRFIPGSCHPHHIRPLLKSVRGCFLLFFCCLSTICHAAGVTVVWDPSSDPNVAGYEIHYGSASGNYVYSADVGQTTSFAFSNVQQDESYYVAALAYDIYGNKSDFSQELAFSAIFASTDGNGTISPSDVVIAVHNSSQTFTISPNPNYRLADVMVDGVSVGPVASYTLNDVAASHHIMASFEPFTTWYVDQSAPYSGDGRSWLSPLQTIQEALDSAKDGDEIWVAGGREYQLAQPLEISRDIKLYGGFEGNETNRDQRNWDSHKTTINAAGRGQCFIVAANASIDGFSMVNGNGNYGAGVFVTSGEVSILNCRFYHNIASLGGAIYLLEGVVSLANCEFQGNGADYGAAIYSDSKMVVANCTFAQNTAAIGGGAFATGSSGDVSVKNSILWKDAPQEIDLAGGSLHVEYSVVHGGYEGQGNVTADPAFVNLDGGDLRVLASSPCVDAGSQQVSQSLSTLRELSEDLSCSRRIVDGDADGVAVVDMGAYEQTTAKADAIAVYRNYSATFFAKNSLASGFADMIFAFGVADDEPVVGDWNGDGTDTLGLFRNGVFLLSNDSAGGYADSYFTFGTAGDQPIAGDWNGDGIDTVGVYRDGAFFLTNSNGSGCAAVVFSFGLPGDIAIAGDWDGDGVDSIGVFRPSTGAFYLRNANSSGYADIVLAYGLTYDVPVVGDWDGDGRDTIGIYRDGVFMLSNSNTTGFAEHVIHFGQATDTPLGGKWTD